ncbi:glycosyltransferase family 2 protein [Bacteroides sp.]|uniref:glycosyltransferase family 2 protein n=1 Tax=Bacteroides sp. TaxID=29523 RepID=UPI002606B002|nr:glycosyltransferase family 2 protein [Bacteroides sp.]MDD3038762.1 glycosyltransferase family 2 protein [Bacteroides sp.]
MIPLVSIILPNYNHARYLPDRINSILGQTFQNFELIILDDCSTDNSRDVIEQYRNHPKVTHIVYNEQNGGTSYKQWEKGIAYAKGELIWIAESDDLADVHFLEYLTPHFKEPKIVLAFSGIQFFIDKIHTKPIMKEIDIRYNGIDFIRDRLLWGNGICNASMVLFRKDNYFCVDTNLWSKMKLVGDWMLWTNITSQGDVVEQPAKLDYCRRHDTNVTGRFRKLGYDFIEGVKVLNFGKRVCNNRFDCKKVYYKWYDNYILWSKECTYKTKYKIIKTILCSDFYLGYFFCCKLIRRKIKQILCLQKSQ